MLVVCIERDEEVVKPISITLVSLTKAIPDDARAVDWMDTGSQAQPQSQTA
jgi:hypothetical protein